MPASRGCRPNNRDAVSTVGLLRVEIGGEGLGTLMGSWLKKGVGREDTECESQCDWFQIKRQGEGLLLCPMASPGCWRGAPQVHSRIRQWGLCRRNGCDYRPGGAFLPPLWGRLLLLWAELVCKWRGPYYDNVSSSLPNVLPSLSPTSFKLQKS